MAGHGIARNNCMDIQFIRWRGAVNGAWSDDRRAHCRSGPCPRTPARAAYRAGSRASSLLQCGVGSVFPGGIGIRRDGCRGQGPGAPVSPTGATAMLSFLIVALVLGISREISARDPRCARRFLWTYSGAKLKAKAELTAHCRSGPCPRTAGEGGVSGRFASKLAPTMWRGARYFRVGSEYADMAGAGVARSYMPVVGASLLANPPSSGSP